MRGSRKRGVAIVLPLAALFVLAGSRQAAADPPRDWGGGGEGYELLRDATTKHGGTAAGSVKSTGDKDDGFGTLTQGFKAEKYKGKRACGPSRCL